MSHLTARDLHTLADFVDLIIPFFKATKADPSLLLILEAIRVFLPFLAQVQDLGELKECADKEYYQGQLTQSDYYQLKRLIAASKN